MTAPAREPLVVGVDGGATRSRAALAQGDRRLATTAGGPLQLATMPPGEVRRGLEALLGGLPDRDAVEAVCIGAAGADETRAAPALEAARSLLPGARASVVRDVDLVLALSPPPVMALVAGTGVVAVGLAEDGGRVVADGRGFLLGDRGGAYWTGLEALRRGLRRADEEGRPGPLLERLLEELGLPATAALPGLIAGSRVPVARIASLAPLVGTLADEGEEIAASVVEDAVAELLSTVAAVGRRMPFGAAPALILTGGMLTAPGVRSRLEAGLPATELAWAEDGVDGALALARDMVPTPRTLRR